jgi:hypothetical protein
MPNECGVVADQRASPLGLHQYAETDPLDLLRIPNGVTGILTSDLQESAQGGASQDADTMEPCPSPSGIEVIGRY